MLDNNTLLGAYLAKTYPNTTQAVAAAFYAALDQIALVSPSVARSVIKELVDQRANLKLIASENFSSLAVQLAQGNWLTDKYAEGYSGHRFYAGCDNIDSIESEAATLATQLFGADHAYVQPHSGADANLVAFIAVLLSRIQAPALEKVSQSDPTKVTPEDWRKIREEVHNQRMLALDLYSGGHLTHGYRFNFSSHMFDVHYYQVDPTTYLIDLDRLREQALDIKPLILLAGYSAYSRKLDFARMREIADEVGAVLIVDMAHFAGLVAGKVFSGNFDPIPHAHIVTSTTHKTLRGPRGGLILCNREFADWVDKGCPSILGGPLPQAMAAKAVAFREACTPKFRDYAHNIVENAQVLAEACMSESLQVLTGGTDNHIVMIDVKTTFGLTGRQAESALRECRLTLNRNAIPFDQNGPWYTSGLRLGTAAVTTLGMGPSEMREIARIIKTVLSNTSPAMTQGADQLAKPSLARYQVNASVVEDAKAGIGALLNAYPLYPELDYELVGGALRAA